MAGRFFLAALFRPTALRDDSAPPRRRRWRVDTHLQPCLPSASTLV